MFLLNMTRDERPLYCQLGGEKSISDKLLERIEEVDVTESLSEGDLALVRSQSDFGDARPCWRAKVGELWMKFLAEEDWSSKLRNALGEHGDDNFESLLKESMPAGLGAGTGGIGFDPIGRQAMMLFNGGSSRTLSSKQRSEELQEQRHDRDDSALSTSLTRRKSSSRRELSKKSSGLGSRTSSENDVEAAKRQQAIPRFFFAPGEHLAERECIERELIDEFFQHGRATQHDFAELIVEVIGLPSFYSTPFYDKIMQNPEFNPDGEDVMHAETLWRFYEKKCVRKTPAERLFNSLLDGAERNYLIPSDFDPLMQGLLDNHPGLAFLESTPEFQKRFAETAVQRIFYSCAGTQCTSQLTLKQMVRGRLLETLIQADEEEDINAERRFFSYEHFYVLYSGFWELDTDHDLYISFEDLLRYRGYSLTYRIVERVFGGFGRPLDSTRKGYMSYHDYIWFALSEEDKRSNTAIDYWFRCVDLDGDGKISLYDIDQFYSEQTHRLEYLGHEIVMVRDIIRQGLDMIRDPSATRPYITRMDLKRSKLSGDFFDLLFNVNKFYSNEMRETARIRRGYEAQGLSEWERFAACEYLRLTAEEEDDGEDSAWDDLNEQRAILLDTSGNFC